jgi:hypothetical protein
MLFPCLRRPRNLLVGQFEILELRAKDHVQQKRPETVAGDAVHAPKDCEGPHKLTLPMLGVYLWLLKSIP